MRGKWTPGPWYLSSENGRYQVKGPGTIALANLWHPPTGSALDNGRLITAAPALYEALEALANDRRIALGGTHRRRIAAALSQAHPPEGEG